MIRTTLAALLLGTAVALPLAHGAAPQAAHAASGPTAAQAALLGTWRNADPNTRGLTVIQVTSDAFWHKDRAAAWARCHPVDCFWGTDTLDGFFARGFTWQEATYHFAADKVMIRRVGAQLAVWDEYIPRVPWDSRPESDAFYTFVRSS